jgi:hypothetical protein
VNLNAMNAAFVSDECDRDQEETYNQNDTLFVFGEFENPEQAFHFGVLSVMLSEAKHLWPNLSAAPDQVIRDSSLRSE